MSTEIDQRTYTPDDLLRMPDGDFYELVDGQLVEREMSNLTAWVSGMIVTRLNNFVIPKALGTVMSEGAAYQCYADDPRRVRKPDGSFIAKGRMPEDQFSQGFFHIPPDLAVEVVSPNDLYYEVESKVEEYLSAGVKLVWVINPDNRTIRVFHAGKEPRQLDEHAELTGDDLLPGFRCLVKDLFPPRDLPPLV